MLALSYLYCPQLAISLSNPIPSVRPQQPHLRPVILPSSPTLFVSLRRRHLRLKRPNLSMSQLSRSSRMCLPNLVGPTMSLHHFRLSFPPLLPATLAAFILRGFTPSELCANVIAVRVASHKNPEIEKLSTFLTSTPSLSLGVLPTIHTLYPLFHHLVFQQNLLNILLFIFPLFVFLLHLTLIGWVTPVCLPSAMHWSP